MHFIDFLPGLFSVFILWTLISIIFASAFWLFTYGIPKLLPISLKFIHFEHMIAALLGVVIIYIIKRNFFNLHIQQLTGLNRLTLFIISIVFMAGAVWIFRKYLETILHRIKVAEYVEKIMNVLDQRITPIIWIFGLFFMVGVFFIIFNKESARFNNRYYEDSHFRLNKQVKKRPDIIIIVWDALNARDMSMYGYDRPTTPFLNEWLKDATIFTRAYSASNWTYPSTMSILTGQRPWTHRFWHVKPSYSLVGKYKYSLPRLLKYNGYQTYGLVQNKIAHPKGLGMRDAFSVYKKSSTFIKQREWWPYKITRLIKNDLARHWIRNTDFFLKMRTHRPDINVTRSAPERIYNQFLYYLSEINVRGHERAPLFAYLHVLPPHWPYLPDKSYMGIFGDSEQFNTENKQSNALVKEYKKEQQEDVDIMRKRYDEFILYSDHQFQSFISRLSEMINISNTIIIFTSDHGESFSHGYLGHSGKHLYEELVHIPLAIKGPEEMRNHVINVPVEHIDIAPTILEIAHISIPAWMEGQSLYPLITGTHRELKPVFSMSLIKNRAIGNHAISKGTIAVWEGDYKLIHYLSDKKSLLFNLEQDPDELNNLFNNKQEVGQHMLSIIQKKLKGISDKIRN
jgi:arylsulfatase